VENLIGYHILGFRMTIAQIKISGHSFSTLLKRFLESRESLPYIESAKFEWIIRQLFFLLPTYDNSLLKQINIELPN